MGYTVAFAGFGFFIQGYSRRAGPMGFAPTFGPHILSIPAVMRSWFNAPVVLTLPYIRPNPP